MPTLYGSDEGLEGGSGLYVKKKFCAKDGQRVVDLHVHFSIKQRYLYFLLSFFEENKRSVDSELSTPNLHQKTFNR